MSRANAQKLVSMVNGDPELAKKVRGCDAGRFKTLAASLHLPCTMQEFRQEMSKPLRAVDPDQLEQVAGGLRATYYSSSCGETNTLLSTCTKIDTNTDPKGTYRY